MNLVKIYPCKECGCEQGYQIESQPTLAECKDCQHLSDVDILHSLGFEQSDEQTNLEKTNDSLDSFFNSGKYHKENE
jgi:hypothetical protein